MKTNLLKKIKLGMAAALITGAAPAYAETITKLSEQGFLGSGFDSATQTFKVPCVTGTLAYVGSSNGYVGVEAGVSQERLLTELGMAIGADISLDIISAGGAANFTGSTANTSNSVSAAYVISAAGKNAVLQNLTLTQAGKDAVSKGNVKQVCGDSYIRSLALEAKLLINVKFTFTSSDLKANFQSDANANIMDIIKLNGRMNAAVQKYGRDVKFTVTAVQVGGDVSKLANILKGVETSEEKIKKGVTAQIFKCDIEKYEACYEAISQMINYATEEGGFSSQLNSMTYQPQKSDGPAWMQYGYTSYANSEAQELSSEVTDIGEDIKQKRRSLVRQYLKLSADLGRTQDLLDISIEHSEEKARLQTLQSVIRDNFDVVQNAIKICRENPDSCVNAFAGMTEKLKFYDSREITKMMTFEDYCGLSDENSVTKDTVKAIRTAAKISEKMSCGQAFRYLQDLHKLNLASTKISSLEPLRGLKSLTSLDISDNEIFMLDGIENLKSLEVLNMHHNRVINIDKLKELPNLSHVNFANNNVSNLSALSAMSLVSIRAYGNPLSEKWNHENHGIQNHIITNNRACDLLRQTMLHQGVDIRQAEALNTAPIFKVPGQFGNSNVEGWYSCDDAVVAVKVEPAFWDNLAQ
ncbi:leucine-rich repeat protein [Bdellovibrio bacteriovorus]|nr:leucine-rich repeat protein [Bdellovibrio bacteriovorus]